MPPYGYYPMPYNPAEDEIDLLEYWRILAARKWLIVLITVLFTAAAVAVALLMTPIYRAEVLPTDGAGCEVIALIERSNGTVKRYRLTRDEEQPVGPLRHALQHGLRAERQAEAPEAHRPRALVEDPQHDEPAVLETNAGPARRPRG